MLDISFEVFKYYPHKAKHYIYRNLNKGNLFSIRYKGIVVNRLENFTAYNVKFKVNESGILKVIENRIRNVHAFVVCDMFVVDHKLEGTMTEITYNPFDNDSFMFNGSKITEAPAVYFANGKAYYVNS